MVDATTQFYFCQGVLERSDIMPLLVRHFEGEICLINPLFDLSEFVERGYEKWCADNGGNNFCVVFDYHITPTVANMTVDYMLEHKRLPPGPLVTQWTVEVMDEANAEMVD